MTEIETMTEAIFDAVKGYVEQQTGALMRKVHELEERLAKLPAPKNGENGKDATVDYERIAVWCVTHLQPKAGEKGERGERGESGESIDVAALETMVDSTVQAKVQKAVDELPKPKDGQNGKDGKDFDPSEWKQGHEALLDEICDTDINLGKLEKEIAELKARPVPTNGKDGANGKDAVVDYDMIRREIVELIPIPVAGKDGKDAVVDYGIIFSQLKEMIPEPISGKDGINGKDAPEISSEVLSGLVTLAVAAEVEKIPKPKDGLNAVVDYDLIREEIKRWIPDPIPGKPGKDGTSVDLADLQVHVIDAVQKAVAELPKPEPGERGAPGSMGKDAVVDYDQVETMIAKLIPPVKDGKDGERGREGAPGRDALEIEPLSEIDLTRSYARRTYALHNGGLWVARRSQPGIESWECVVPGISAIGLHQHPEDERCLSLQVTMSDGKQITRQASFPVMLHRGTWKPGKYEHGDVVTRDGSSWHAQRDTEAQPGADHDWQMIVKRGQPGKDAGSTNRDDKNKVVRLR